jgi:hypothetical protein
VSAFLGKTPVGADPTKDLSGGATLDVDATAVEPANHVIQGSLNAGKLDTLHLPVGAFPIEFPLSDATPPVRMTLYAAHVQATVRAANRGDAGTRTTLIEGVFNGGLSAQDIHSQLIPAIAAMLQAIIDKNANPDTTAQLLMTFDHVCCGPCDAGTGTLGDGKIEPCEVENNFLVQALLSPDIDLFDASGNLNPNSDGVPDSLSMGAGFTAVPAIFPDQQ